MNIEPHTLPWQDAYKLLIGSILPRPIAFVSTISADGVSNVAPFSFFTAICADPMMVCFSPMYRGSDGKKKDTLQNIEETREFVINIVHEEIAEQMNHSAIEFAPEVDEFYESGLTKEESSKVKSPRVKESLIHLECNLDQIISYDQKPGSGCLVIGKVLHIHIDDKLYYDGKINTELLKPIGRMAGNVFTRANVDTFSLERRKKPIE